MVNLPGHVTKQRGTAMPATGYTRTQIRLHWAVVVLVALQFIFHEGIAEAFDRGLEAGQMTLTGPAVAHMAAGSLILLLAFWRLNLRREQGTPPPPAGEPDWAKLAAKATHWAFYALLILLPITGAAAWGGQSEAAGAAHEVMRALLFFLVLAHIGAVIVHQFVWKTGLMERMKTPVD